MDIVNRELKEFIDVYHRDLEEFKVNQEKLKQEGWSDNIMSSNKQLISNTEIDDFQKSYPNCIVQVPENSPNSYIYESPFVYYSRHEKPFEG